MPNTGNISSSLALRDVPASFRNEPADPKNLVRRSTFSLAISVTRQAGARRSQERAVFRARQASAWRVTETAILQE